MSVMNSPLCSTLSLNVENEADNYEDMIPANLKTVIQTGMRIMCTIMNTVINNLKKERNKNLSNK